MELKRPTPTPVLPEWDLGIVLEAIAKPPYEPLWAVSLKHLTYKTVFLSAMASAGRCSELQALVSIPNTCKSSLRALVLHSIFALNLCKNQ